MQKDPTSDTKMLCPGVLPPSWLDRQTQLKQVLLHYLLNFDQELKYKTYLWFLHEILTKTEQQNKFGGASAIWEQLTEFLLKAILRRLVNLFYSPTVHLNGALC